MRREFGSSRESLNELKLNYASNIIANFFDHKENDLSDFQTISESNRANEMDKTNGLKNKYHYHHKLDLRFKADTISIIKFRYYEHREIAFLRLPLLSIVKSLESFKIKNSYVFKLEINKFSVEVKLVLYQQIWFLFSHLCISDSTIVLFGVMP